MKTVIMAGGKGTRISSVKSDVPKPMIPIGGKPILEWQIDNLKRCGLTDITLVIGHLGHVIKDYFDNGLKFGVKIDYFIEEEPLGTAGALFRMNLTDDFLLLCGDIIIDVDFNRIIQFHQSKNALATLVTHPNNHPYDSSIIVTETLPPQEDGGLPVDTHRVILWLNKEDSRGYYKNRVNSGIEVISPSILKDILNTGKVDLDRDVLKPNVMSRRVFAYDTTEYIKDVGAPERFHEAEIDLKNGKVHSKNLINKQRAVFLDRDGTINKYVGFLRNAEQFELIEGVADAIRLINKAGYLAVVVTNQPVIARGECTWNELGIIHNKMETELGKKGAFVDAIYVCPHHPDNGYYGELIAYKCECDCRKPKCGLLLQAAKDLNINISNSIMIGDSESDVRCGEAAGCMKSVLVERNAGNKLLNLIRNENKFYNIL